MAKLKSTARSAQIDLVDVQGLSRIKSSLAEATNAIAGSLTAASNGTDIATLLSKNLEGGVLAAINTAVDLDRQLQAVVKGNTNTRPVDLQSFAQMAHTFQNAGFAAAAEERIDLKTVDDAEIKKLQALLTGQGVPLGTQQSELALQIVDPIQKLSQKSELFAQSIQKLPKIGLPLQQAEVATQAAIARFTEAARTMNGTVRYSLLRACSRR